MKTTCRLGWVGVYISVRWMWSGVIAYGGVGRGACGGLGVRNSLGDVGVGWRVGDCDIVVGQACGVGWMCVG
jgi:hypothetical protein